MKTTKSKWAKPIAQLKNSEHEYTFKLFPTKTKQFTRSHYCDSDNDAFNQLIGMQYAMFFEHKHPRAELWRDGKCIHRIS